MNASVAVYLRNNEVIVVPVGGRGGLFYELDDVRVVPPSERDLQQAVQEELNASAEEFGGAVPDLTTRKWNLPRRLGLKSARAFYDDVAYCSVFVEDDKIEVVPQKPRPDNRGFEPHGYPVRVAERHSLASAILRVLTESPRMTRRGG